MYRNLKPVYDIWFCTFSEILWIAWDCFTESDEIIKENSAEPLQVIAQELEKAGIVSYIRLNQPFCRYDSNFLKQFMNSKRVMSTCAVKKQQGIFVDPDLNIILCNELRHIVMGNYQKDFWDYGSMNRTLSAYIISWQDVLCRNA